MMLPWRLVAHLWVDNCGTEMPCVMCHSFTGLRVGHPSAKPQNGHNAGRDGAMQMIVNDVTSQEAVPTINRERARKCTPSGYSIS